MTQKIIPIGRALLSVSDRDGIVGFARSLAGYGAELVSTGGTAKALRAADLKVRDVADITQFPEMMDGRVKTLHPAIHGGLLALRDTQAHMDAMAAHNIAPIDLLVVNLYPFEKTVASGADDGTCIENIDIGGPAMIRAAAKNHAHVGVVTDPGDYPRILEDIATHGGLSHALRRALAAAAYARTARYDSAIAAWFAQNPDEAPARQISIGGTRAQTLRYGENPHQAASFYRSSDLEGGSGNRVGIANARQIQGKDLSYNNINDSDAALELAAELDDRTHGVAIIKHANPCGVAARPDQRAAYLAARNCDPVSAFGGIIAFNQPLQPDTAEALVTTFNEVIIAPDAGAAAIDILRAKPDLRLLLTGSLPDPYRAGHVIKPVSGGFLWQSRDNLRIEASNFQVVTDRTPGPAELEDMIFAFTVAKHVKSNAIVYAKAGATVGIGAGQMSRLDATRIAIRKSRDAMEATNEPLSPLQGSVVASDAFFPFADGLVAAAEAGATAAIQPGGSIRDKDVIAAANEAGIAMIFTGSRHFRH